MVKSPLVGLAVASLAVIALAGCTASSPTPASQGTSAPTASGAPASSGAPGTSDATYSSDDLVAILTATKKTLGSAGSILDNAHLKKAASKTGGVSALLSEKGVTISPASCAKTLTTKLPSSANAFGLGDKAIAAALIESSTTNPVSISVASVSSGTLPAAATSQLASSVDDLISACGTMTMKLSFSGAAVTANVKLTKFEATSDATQTVGIRETTVAKIGSQSSTLVTTIVDAHAGNLFIVATNPVGAKSITDADLSKQIDTVIAAAAALK